MEFPQINGQRSWKDLLMDMVDDFVLRGADGQLAALKAMQKEQTGEYEVYGSPLWNDTQKKEAGDAKVYNYKSGQKMYEKVYELPWEVEVFEKLLEEKVYPQIGKGSKVKITGAVSENIKAVSYTHLRAHETRHDLVCRLLLEKKKKKKEGQVIK